MMKKNAQSTIRVLIDVSHHESITSFPDNIFQDTEITIHFTAPTYTLTDLFYLEQYDLVILGDPRFNSDENQLFFSDELITLKQYVANGGCLLITSGAKGDQDYPKPRGSLRVFYNLTGVSQLPNGVLFHPQEEFYFESKKNLAFDDFPDHPVFSHFTDDDELFLGKSTYLILDPENEQENKPEIIFSTLTGTAFHHYNPRKNEVIDEVPLIVGNHFYKGKILIAGMSDFLRLKPISGLQEETTQKLLKGIFGWLLDREIQ